MKHIKLTAAIALLVIGSACASKTVNDVMADPHRYADRNIALRGRVIESYSVAGTGFYRLEDTPMSALSASNSARWPPGAPPLASCRVSFST